MKTRVKPPKVRIAVAGAGLAGQRHIDIAVHDNKVRLSAIVDPALASELGEVHGLHARRAKRRRKAPARKLWITAAGC